MCWFLVAACTEGTNYLSLHALEVEINPHCLTWALAQQEIFISSGTVLVPWVLSFLPCAAINCYMNSKANQCTFFLCQCFSLFPYQGNSSWGHTVGSFACKQLLPSWQQIALKFELQQWVLFISATGKGELCKKKLFFFFFKFLSILWPSLQTCSEAILKVEQLNCVYLFIFSSAQLSLYVDGLAKAVFLSWTFCQHLCAEEDCENLPYASLLRAVRNSSISD